MTPVLVPRLILLAGLALPCGACAAGPFEVVASRFKYRVPFEIGATQSEGANRIEITELWGTRPQIEVGGDYLVVGTYSLESLEEARICFYLTARNWDNSGPDTDLLRTTVKKGSGSFALVHSMPGPGYFHASMSGITTKEQVRVANVYFGKGDNLLQESTASGRAP